jgi:hypothetical protein
MSRRLFGPLALAVLIAAAPTAAAEKDTAPISVQVTSALAGEKGFGRIMSSASTGDVEDTASDLEGQLRKFPWLQLVGRDPEVTVLVDRRSRTETSRTTNKKGEVTINHRYTASATVAIGDGERDRVEADTTYSQGPSATRDDSSHFDTVAKELANNISSRILQSLDRLRPNRPQAGFAHKAKYKMLFRGDGLEVVSVEPGSPAEEAGLQVGDRIRAIDGEKGTDQMNSKVLSWWTDLPGARYNLEVERNKQRRPVQISLLPPARWGGRSARPAPAAPTSRPAATREPAAAPSRPAAAASGSVSSAGGSGVELKAGMTQAQVVRALGEPQKKVAFGPKVIWTYDGFTVTFVDGKVTDVK